MGNDSVPVERQYRARWHLRYTLASTIFCLLCLNGQPVAADTIIFNDLTDNISITTTSTRVTDVSCGINTLSEFCLLTLNPPSTTAMLLSPSSATLGIAETGSTNGSDELAYGHIVGTQILTFNFFSDLDPGPPIITCSPPVTSCMTETGAIQTAFQLSWNDGTLDTIQFRSDVPAAASWLLVLVGCAALGVAKRAAVSGSAQGR